MELNPMKPHVEHAQSLSELISIKMTLSSVVKRIFSGSMKMTTRQRDATVKMERHRSWATPAFLNAPTIAIQEQSLFSPVFAVLSARVLTLRMANANASLEALMMHVETVLQAKKLLWIQTT